MENLLHLVVHLVVHLVLFSFFLGCDLIFFFFFFLFFFLFFSLLLLPSPPHNSRSAPDAFASFIAARKDKQGAKMAISNVFGSNIFDIMIALALPIVLFSGGAGAQLDLTENLVSVVVLFCIFVFFWCALLFGKPQLTLNKWLGWVSIGMYVGYVVYVVADDLTRRRAK